MQQPSSGSIQACERCHRRKTRCDKVRPACGPCIRARVSCLYPERIKEPVFKREHVEKLQRQLIQLEEANRNLKTQLEEAQSEVLEARASCTSSANSAAAGAAGAAAPPGGPAGRTAEAPSGMDDDVANEVSFLSTTAGGDRQFLGSASGLLFASLVRASVAAAAAQQNGEEGRSSSISTQINSAGRNGINSGGGGGGGSAGAAVAARRDWGIDAQELPPQQLARSLIEAYLAHDHLCFPFLLPQTVRATVEAIYSDPLYYARHPFEAFMFNMLLAIATSQIHKFNWQALPDAETHHLRATVHLNTVLCEGGLKALQAMLLLCVFRLSSSTKDESGSLWHIVGISARMCYELGLHRESTYKLKPNPSITSAEFCTAYEEQEVRRRCFWCVFCLDRVVSITLGRPLAISLDDIDIELPIVDTENTTNTPSVSSPSDEAEAKSITSSSRTAIFVQIVRYRRLCGKLLTALHRGGRNAMPTESNLHQIRRELAAELDAWRADTANLNLPEMDLSTPIAEARSSFRSAAWYELLYHNGMLLLYRPSSSTSSASSSTGDATAAATNGPGPTDLQRLFTSAKGAITLYSYLFRSRKINFSWITLHATFMAGLSYVYAVSRHIRETRYQQMAGIDNPKTTLNQNPTIMEIVNDCRACSNILVAVSERRNAQKSCHEVFDRLSDAILADAVELLSSSTANAAGKTAESAAAAAATATSAGRLPASAQPARQHQTPNSQATLPAAAGGPSEGGHSAPYRPEAPPFRDDMADATGFSNEMQDFSEPMLAADSALRDCFPDIQRMYSAQWGDDAIMQLGIDWLGEIDPGNGMLTGDTMETDFM